MEFHRETDLVIRYSFIEKAEEELLKQILDLYRLAGWWPEEPDPPLVARMISGSHCFLTAMDGKRLVGMARAISDRANDAYLQDLTVHPDYRRQGIGTRLVKTLLARLQADGLPWIGLIAERNSSSFYAPSGFEPMPDSTPMLFRKP
ncbi:GNAT family N-acetyltransferase [Syntrophus gentianae]|uniref:GNAT family N-acetyltransferase n=1 Tax=Syntrophus gentianae TaxID=43775 RepID=UPI001F4920CD|nr:GNAT family N-acetyltransferase [Syntrophus gentianae]